MPKALYEPIAVGDSRPIAVDVTPSDDAQVTAATYRIVRRSDPGSVIWNAGGVASVSPITGGFTIATQPVIFPTADVYTAQFTLTWNDGQIDNTVSAVIPVALLPN